MRLPPLHRTLPALRPGVVPCLTCGGVLGVRYGQVSQDSAGCPHLVLVLPDNTHHCGARLHGSARRPEDYWQAEPQETGALRSHPQTYAWFRG